MTKKPLLLMILDGFGISNKSEGNAVCAAHKPNIDSLFKSYPNTSLKCSGLDVGLPEGQMGNSEVGHLNIGAGRIIYQELTRISKSIKDGDFFENESLNFAIDEAIKNNSYLHLLGLLSGGGVHSHIEHLKALLLLCKKKNFKNVFVHAFMDGRDVRPDSGINYISELVEFMKNEGIGKIATISGRYYAMDRDKRWDRVEKAYNAMVYGEGNIEKDPVQVMKKSYDEKVTDEFVIPSVIVENGVPVAKIKNNDSVIFFNFRPDRAREITRALNDSVFDGFKRESMNLNYVCMTQYDATLENVKIAYKPQSYNNTFGEYISSKGLTQLRIAETEKYAHVTFFFNGGVEAPNKNEDRDLIPSPKVATYDLKPEMSAYEVTDELLNKIESDKYDVIILNYANCDMVGHTGVFEAAKSAVEAVDVCVGKVVNKILEKDGTVFLTADHGNSEQMLDEKNMPMTAHTTNPVPFIYISKDSKEMRDDGRLCDISPTMLKVLNLPIPDEMTGKSLF